MEVIWMKTLYIIGNGFDMAHGLDTGYWKFREYLEEHYPDFLCRFEELYDIATIDVTDPRITNSMIKRWEESVKNTLWSKLEDMIGKPNIQYMLDFSQSILEDMDLDGGNIYIEDTMDFYWQDHNKYINFLQDYLLEWIESIDTTKVSVKSKKLFESNDLFLNFNYTDVLENTYRIEDVFHVHGGVKAISDIQPIIGHCNKTDIDNYERLAKDAEDTFSEGEASINKAVANYLKSIYKDTDSIIKVNKKFWNQLSNVNHVVIIGWSAGEVDAPYLKIIRDNISRDSKWTYYWHTEDARKNIYDSLASEGIIGKFLVDDYSSDLFWD